MKCELSPLLTDSAVWLRLLEIIIQTFLNLKKKVLDHEGFPLPCLFWESRPGPFPPKGKIAVLGFFFISGNQEQASKNSLKYEAQSPE